jgi:diguanylate cyclase (GGDEF)-like protein
MTEVTTCPMCGGSGGVDSASALGNSTLSDRDQTASDADQTWSDHDQSGSDRDQRSADEDQQASDDDFAAGGDPVLHQRTAAAREHTTQDRADISELRDQVADSRVATAEERDHAAELRDHGATGRDRLAGLHDSEHDLDASTDDVLLRAARDRARAAADRVKAADDRATAAADRAEAARERAESRRLQTKMRETLARAATDNVTGTWIRSAGLASVAREIERASRTHFPLTLAFIDVDGLKEVNDMHGHLAGDRLLRLVGDTVIANVRPYDVVVRYGGDEFVCAMPGLTREAATERMQKIAAALNAAETGHSIAVGLAEYVPGDGVKELIGRADADLLDARRSGAHE